MLLRRWDPQGPEERAFLCRVLCSSSMKCKGSHGERRAGLSGTGASLAGGLDFLLRVAGALRASSLVCVHGHCMAHRLRTPQKPCWCPGRGWGPTEGRGQAAQEMTNPELSSEALGLLPSCLSSGLWGEGLSPGYQTRALHPAGACGREGTRAAAVGGQGRAGGGADIPELQSQPEGCRGPCSTHWALPPRPQPRVHLESQGLSDAEECTRS